MSKLFYKIASKALSASALGFLVVVVACNSAFAFGKSPQLFSNVEDRRAPEIEGITNWLNSKPLKISEQKGKVVLVDFWTYSCINCIRTLPHMNDLQEKFGDKGLVIIGIHAPEFDFEKDEKNVAAAVKRFDIKYAVGLDNNRKTWDSFENRYWPAHYLIDQDGNIVYTHFGEGEYDVMENNIRALLKISGKSAAKKDSAWLGGAEKQTPETYLGSDRADRNANDQSKNLTFPKDLPLHSWALEGKWKVEAQHSQTLNAAAALRFNFQAKKVFLVMDSKDGKPINVEVKLNGVKITVEQAGADVKDGAAIVSSSRLYELVQMKKAAKGVLEIKADRPGLRVYAFTFG